MDDITLVKASLQAGLQLYGRPNPNTDDHKTHRWSHIKEWCKLFNINHAKYKDRWEGSGLIWSWDKGYKIHRMTFTQSVIYQCYCVGFKDFDECVGNCYLSDVYTFLPDGTGFDIDNPFDKRQWYDNTIAFYWNSSITELSMDLPVEEVFFDWLNDILSSKAKTKKYMQKGKVLEGMIEKLY